jgi:glycosyltransferase involved in cell wall biosynthesis
MGQGLDACRAAFTVCSIASLGSMSSNSVAMLSEPQPMLKVSVVIPVYNAERFVAATLMSVLQQDYEAFEVIVVDDGSHDRSVAIVSRFAQEDQRIRLIQTPNQGVAAARNRAIAAASGDLIAPIDADDLWHPQFLAQHVQLHQRYRQIADCPMAVSYCWSLDVNHQDQWTSGFQAATIQGWVHNTLLCHNFLGNGSCTVMRRSALQQVQGYRCQFDAVPPVDAVRHLAMGQAVCEDWDLYLRLAEHYPFGVVPAFYVGYRKHPHSASQRGDRMTYWHQQLLADRRSRRPDLRPWVWQLSQRSFQNYLQQLPQSLAAPPRATTFPPTGPLPLRDRCRIWRKVRLASLLHWLIRHFGQRSGASRPAAPVL